VEGVEVLLNIPVSTYSPFWGGMTRSVCILFINSMNRAAQCLSNVMLSGYLFGRKIICHAHCIDWELETVIIFEWLLDTGCSWAADSYSDGKEILTYGILRFATIRGYIQTLLFVERKKVPVPTPW
jgi:hypothetical protein